MSLNSHELNSIPLNGGAVSEVLSGTLVTLDQTVAIVQEAGPLVTLDQTVQLRETLTGTLVTLDQDVQATLSAGPLVTLDQTVRDISVPSHLTRTGWDLDIYIGGEALDKSEIIRVTDVVFSENDSALANIVLRGSAGAQDLDYYDGKSVQIVGRTYSGGNNKTISTDLKKRIFTGIVDITEIDVINEFIVLRCVNERRKLINTNLAATVKTVGTWSEAIFGQFRDSAEELDQRISTVQKSANFDGYNNFLLTSWTPKGTADFTFADSNIFTEAPRLERASAAKLINKIVLKMQYRYERLHHRQKSFSWISDAHNNPCRILTQGYDMTRRDMILEAIKNTGWPIRGSVTFGGPPAAGWYSCSGSYVALSYTQTTAKLVQKTQYNGPSTPDTNVVDENGDPVYEAVTTGATNYDGVFCTSASWVGTTRWSQTVTEEQTVTITAPQSISQYGTIERDQTFGVQDDFDTSQWEDYANQGYSNNSPNGDATYFLDQDYDEAGFALAFRTALDRAKTTILGSHRDTRVIITVPFQPDIKLGDTVATTATRLTCKGVIERYTHRFDHSTTEATTQIDIVLSRSTGSTTDQTLAIPARLNTDSAPGVGGTINLGNHFGQDPTQSGAESWTGFVGNKVVNGVKTNYAQSFIVDVPAIENAVRSNKTLTGSTSYTIEVPNDALSVTFEGKSLA